MEEQKEGKMTIDEYVEMLSKDFEEAREEQLPTISEMLVAKRESDQFDKMTFSLVDACYKKAIRYRKYIISSLTGEQVGAKVAKGISMLINPRVVDVLEGVYLKATSTKEELKNERVLLESIRNATKELKKENIGIYNAEISMLLLTICSKNSFLVRDFNEYKKTSEFAAKGITYYGTNKNQDSLTEANKAIDASVMRLGLKK
jgi:hypothetical protein